MIERPSVSPSRLRRFRVVVLGLAVLLGVPACGKKGPPLPPIRVVPAATGKLTVRQIGRDVVVAADLPGVRSDGTPIAAGSGVRLLRLEPAEGLRPGAVSDRYLVQQFERQARIVELLAGETLQAHVVGGRLLYVDEDPAGPSATTMRRFLYGLQVVDPKGASSPPRPPSEIEWVPPPPTPVDLKAEVAEGEVRLTWTPGETPPASKSAARRYALYRKEASAPREPEAPVHPGLLQEPAYVDRTFRYDVDYRYTVREVVSEAPGAGESASAEAIVVRPHDSFPPATPAGLAVAAEGETIKVYWFPNTEPDLAGYRVYRRQEGKDAAERAGEVSASETSWVDTGALPGVRYHYSVSAYDDATPPNESPRTEERSERRPGPPRSGAVLIPPAPHQGPA